jgi:hypothetical protein
MLWGYGFKRIPMLGQFAVLYPEQVIEGIRPACKGTLANHQDKLVFTKHLMDPVIVTGFIDV